MNFHEENLLAGEWGKMKNLQQENWISPLKGSPARVKEKNLIYGVFKSSEQHLCSRNLHKCIIAGGEN